MVPPLSFTSGMRWTCWPFLAAHTASTTEVEELTKMRYNYPWGKEKDNRFRDEEKRRALGMSSDVQIHIAAGQKCGEEKRMFSTATLLDSSQLRLIQNHSSQMAASDYLVSLESDVFVCIRYDGNMAKVIKGHQRFVGYKKMISLDRRLLVKLIDRFDRKSLSLGQFSSTVKAAPAHRTGEPTRKMVIPDGSKEED